MNWFGKMGDGVILLVVIFSFAFVSSLTVPSPGHDGNDVFVAVSGVEMTLQEAIDAGKFSVDYFGGDSYSGGFDFGHSDDIFVKVSGVNAILQEAIVDKTLCLSVGGESGSYSDVIELGHNGSEIVIDFDGEKTLQDAINEGKFGDKVWMPLASTECIGDTFTQTKCGLEKEDVAGTKDCDGDCVGSWDMNYGSCSATDCGTDGNYDKFWTTTTAAFGGGTACPDPVLVDDGGNACSAPACVVEDCAGFWNMNYGPCSSTVCGVNGRFNRLWITTTFPSNGGTPCPSPIFVNNGGFVCSAPPCPAVNCVGFWNMHHGLCSATDCGVTGRFNRLWITITPASNGGTPCPSPIFVNNGGFACNAPACPAVDCVGSWDMNYGSCSATACGTDGNYDRLWTTTTSASNGGTACPSPTLVNDGGNACSTAACPPSCTCSETFAADVNVGALTADCDETAWYNCGCWGVPCLCTATGFVCGDDSGCGCK